MSCARTQHIMTRPGLEPGPLNLEFSTIAIRPLCLSGVHLWEIKNIRFYVAGKMTPCLLMGGVHLMEVSAHGRCLLVDICLYCV